ncbi:hypothetical protein Tco_0295937 [Tanacetum coccineum]
MSENIKALDNVIEDKPHFITKVVDNHFCALAMFAKHFMANEEDCLEGYDGAGGGEVNGRGVVFKVEPFGNRWAEIGFDTVEKRVEG